jgi:hypothetical protein
MNKWIKILIGLVIVGVIGGIAGYVFVYNKPHPDIENKKPDYSLTAVELFQSYRNNQQATSEKYNGKVLEITGNVTRLETSGDLTIAVFGLDEGIFGVEGIRVTMHENHKEAIKNHDLSKQITIKGLSDGFNDPDVVIRHGSIVN